MEPAKRKNATADAALPRDSDSDLRNFGNECLRIKAIGRDGYRWIAPKESILGMEQVLLVLDQCCKHHPKTLASVGCAGNAGFFANFVCEKNHESMHC